MNIVSWLETLNGLGFKTAWVLLSLLWQSSILLAAAGLLAFVLRRKRASVRHAVWIIALLAAPALPLLGWFGSYLNAPQREIPVMPSYSAPAVVSPVPPVEFYEPSGESTPPPPLPFDVEQESRISLTAYPWALAFLIYATGLILFLSLVVAGRLRIGRWIRKGNLVTDTDVLSAFEAARKHFGLRRPFLLVESEYVQAPMTIRTLRPVVLLPTGLTQNLSDAELRAVAIHEMAHIKRNDGLLLTLASFVRAVLFFHPLVWLACRQISLLAEQVADDAVLEATGEALPYAQMLARLAEGLTRRSLSTELAAGIVLSKSAFLRRVEAILSARRDRIRKLSRLALIFTILATVASLALATALPLGQKSPAEVPAVVVAEKVKLQKEKSLVVATEEGSSQAHIAESERQITDAVNLKSYVKAALLSERLLGDYQRTKTYLLRRWDQVKGLTQEYPRWFVAMHLARCSAHLGNFNEVDSWTARAKELYPNRTFGDKVEEEIARCRRWVPSRNALKAEYSANPSLETARELLRAYRMLDEYMSMKKLTEEMLSRFAGDAWLESEEFQSTRRFLAAYYAPRPLEKKAEEPATIPAQDDQIEAVFQKLHENWNKRNDFAWQKWVQASAIEKAKFFNLYIHAKSPKGFDWEPDEEEATKFLDSFGLTGKGDEQERAILRQRLGMEGMRLTKDEEAQFSSLEASLIDSLISMDGAAIRDLLAKIQDAPWNTAAGREAGWAAEALGRMGDEGIEALAQEVEKTFSPTQHGHLRYYKMRRLVQGLASSQSPQAIPALRRALDLPNRHTRGPAIDGLAKIPGGLTQEMLLALWESSDDYIREKAARFLAERGDEKAIETFERDIPTAYAKARYKAEEAVWQIKRRLGLAPGERPERVRVTKENTDPWWQGIEKSIKSPNKGIRVTAVQRLGAEAERNAEKFAPLLEVVLKHPDREVRLKATESTEYAFIRQVAERTQRRESLAPLNEVFDTLAEAAATGDEDLARAALGAAYYFRYFEDRPGYQGVIKRVLEGMDSSNTPFRASCIWAFQGLFSNGPELIRRYVSPAQKEATFRAVMAGLSSEYKRYKMDAISVATMLGFTEATPALAEIVNMDKRSNYRSAAARALGKIGDARAIPALEHMAETDPNVDQYGLYSNRGTAWRAIQAIQERVGKAKSEKAEAPEFKQVRYFARPWSANGRGKLTFDGELASPGGGFWKVYYSASDVVDRAEQYTPYNAMLRNVIFKYDQEDRISEIEGYRYGAPWMKQKFSYDEKGQLAEVAFFGPTGKLSNTQRYKYDAEGQMKEMLVYDSKGVLEGTTKRRVYENGRVVESDHYDAEGKLEHSYKWKYDQIGRLVESWDSDGLGYPNGKRGEHTVKHKYNDQGWLVERATYDVDGKLRGLDRYQYAEDGKILERSSTWTQDDGERTVIEKFEYDDEGRIVDSTEHFDGRLGRIRKYNESQRASDYIEIEYDREGNISQRTEYEFDEKGRQTQRRFGPDGKLQEILECDYDEEGRLIRITRRYGPDGTLREIFGYGRDEKGRQIKRHYGPDDRLERITKYDEFGRQRETIHYDEKEKIKERWEYDYDGDGRRVESRLYGPDGQFREIYEYDEKGRRNSGEAIYYDEQGKVETRLEYDYDGEGRRVERRLYGPDGKLRKAWKYEYDEKGGRTKTRHYGPDGKLIEEEDTGRQSKGAKVPEEAATSSATEAEPTGPRGYAFFFDGVDDFLEVPDSASLNFADEFTIEMWIKPAAFGQTDKMALLSKEAPFPKPEGFGLYLEKSPYTGKDPQVYAVLTFFTADGKDREGTGLGIVKRYLTEDGWFHYAAVYTQNEVDHFVNGKEAGMGQHAAAYTPARGKPLFIGRSLFGIGSVPVEQHFTGAIDEVCLWNRARTQAEILRDMKRSLTGNEPGLVACWTFNERPGQVAQDISPYHNVARLGTPPYPDDADPKWLPFFVSKEKAPGEKAKRPVGDEDEQVKKAVVVKDARHPSGWKATLPNGVTVELLGVSYNPSEGQPWWRPDGSPLAEAPSNAFKDRLLPDERSRAYEFVTRVTGLPGKDIVPNWKVIPGPSTLASVRPYSEENEPLNFEHWAAVFPKDQESFALRGRVPAGAWETLSASPGGEVVSGEDYTVIFSKPLETSDRLAITVSHTLTTEKDFRLVLVDIHNKIHRAHRTQSGSSAGVRQTTFYFDKLPLQKVKEFRFQTRPYQWVEFRNISLRPRAATRNNESAWGEAVEGVRVRLRPDKTVWKAGEMAFFEVDIRNYSLRHMTVAPTQETCEVEFDGHWYKWSGVRRYAPKALPRGGKAEGIVISLFDTWHRKKDDEPLALTPGTHTIRVACQPEYQKSARERQVVRVVSNPVQIQILTGKARVAADEWGPPVEGVRCRLRAEKPIWNAGEVPMVLADARNDSERGFRLTPAQEVHELEFDGSWYKWGESIRLKIRVAPFSPGRQVNGIRFSLDKRWASKKDDERLQLAPGKHTVRVAFIAQPSGADKGDPLRTISNPVEITIERALPGSRARGKVAQPAEDKDSPNTDLFSGESSTGRRIFGLVVDTEGRPVGGARVSAWSYASGQLVNATMLHTHTDEDGRFDVVVPFPDARYTLEICKGGYSETSSVFSGDGREIKLVLKTGPTHVLTGTVKDAETGVAARDTRVLLIGEYGFRGDVKTDETGRFEIQGVPNYIGQGVLYARADGRISPFRLVRGRDKYVEVGLGLPARLKGLVKEYLSGKPLAGCAVTAKPRFASAFSIQTTTGDDGRFELTGLPPGKYQVGASSDNYYEPPTRGDFLERPDVPLNPGVTQFYQIALREKATVKGQVLGPDGRPATDAVVGMRATWDMDSVKQWCTARVDKQGRFILRSGRLHRRETVEAFSSKYGSGSATVEGLAEGETRENVTIRLSGAARVRGVVTGPSGVPLKNISVQRGAHDVTDEEGRFDLGRIALPTSEHTAEIKFRSPRPHRGDLHMWRDDGSRQPARKPEPGARFFHHRSVPFEATHGEDVNLEVALEPTEVLTFSGRVFDHAGGPVPGASVMLFAGNASRETLRSTLHPHFGGKDLVVVGRRAIPLCLTITDDKGKWAMWAVRETEESFKIKHWSPPNAACYSLGVEGPEGYSTIVTDIVFEKGQTEQAIEIRLGKPPAEETILGRVVDTNGNPLSGIQLRVGVPTRVVTTGADGGFVFANPGAGKVTISVRTKGWSVVSPEPGRARRSFELAGGKDRVRKVRVVLGEDGSVSGTVRWESGKPVVTYTVSAIRHRLNVSNAQGVFRLEGFPPGEHFLSVRTPEGVYGQQQIKVKPGASVETEVMLPFPEYTIRGRVTDATGAAVAGVTVTLFGKRCETEVLNDEDGRFTFRVPAGSYILTTRADLSKRAGDRERTTVRVGGDVKEVEARLVVSLPQPGHFKLQLIDKENRPLPGIKVRDTHRTYSTDVDGWCVVRGLAPKRYIFWVSDEEQLKNEHMRLTVHIEGGKTTTLEIRLGEGFRVSGRVMCASEPVRNIHVRMSTEDGRRNSSAHTEPDGRFQFINLPEGRLSVKCTPYETNQPTTESLDIQGDVDDLVIHLPTGRILGRLLDYRGRALPGGEVRVTYLDEPAESRRQFTRCFDDGQLDLKYLKDGKYLLELMQDRSALTSYGPVTISDGETLRGIVIQEPGESSEAEHPPATQPAAKSEETAPTEAPAASETEEVEK